MELKKIFCNHKCNGQIFTERDSFNKKTGKHYIKCSKCGKRKFVD